MLYIDLGNDPNAQAELDKLIADFNDHPKLPETVIEIGLKYYSKAHYSEADGNDERAAQYYLKAIAVWERVLAEFPPSASYTPWAYYISAVVYSQELRRYAEGIACYSAVVDNWPNYEYAWHAQYFIGKYYEKLRDAGGISAEEANPLIEQAYQAVVENYPDSRSAPRALLILAGSALRTAQWSQAAAYLEQFLDKYPDNPRVPDVLYDLARAYEQMGQLEPASNVYQRFMDMANPNDPRVETVQAKLNELEGRN